MSTALAGSFFITSTTWKAHSTLLFDSWQIDSADEIFCTNNSMVHSLRAERQGVNKYLKRKQKDGRRRVAP